MDHVDTDMMSYYERETVHCSISIASSSSSLPLRCLGLDFPSLHVSQEGSVFSLPSFPESEEVGRTAAGWRRSILLEDVLFFSPLESLAIAHS